ncbi:hypothetical protein BJX99DRAFT_249147 [Aspergillus californicus]
MKYSVLSIAALRPIHPVDSGDIIINGHSLYDVNVDVEPQGIRFGLPPGKGRSVPGASYQDTLVYIIFPIGDGFKGCVNVSPDGCGSLTWCHGDPSTTPMTCPAGTKLPVTLS